MHECAKAQRCAGVPEDTTRCGCVYRHLDMIGMANSFFILSRKRLSPPAHGAGKRGDRLAAPYFRKVLLFIPRPAKLEADATESRVLKYSEDAKEGIEVELPDGKDTKNQRLAAIASTPFFIVDRPCAELSRSGCRRFPLPGRYSPVLS